MGPVVTELDINIEQIRAKAAEMKAKFREIKTDADGAKAEIKEGWGVQSSSFGRSGAGGGGGGGFRPNIGMAAMQIQDIAVQAQMGMNPATIIGQQGSQLLSGFGDEGMLAGGAVALAAAGVTVAMKNREAFEAATAAVDAFQATLEAIGPGAGVDQITAQFARLREVTAALGEQQENLRSIWGAWIGAAGDAFAGELPLIGRALKLQEEQLSLHLAERQLRRDLIAASAEAVQVATLEANGEKEKVEDLKRQLDLRQQIAKINQSDLPADMKRKLIADAETIAQAQGAAADRSREDAARKRNEAEDAKRGQARDAAAAAAQALREAGMTPAEKLAALNQQRDSVASRLAGATDNTQRYELAAERDKLNLEIVRTQQQMAKEGEQQATARNQRIEALQKNLAEKQFAALADPDKLRALQGRYDDANRRATTSTDAEEKLKAEVERADVRAQMQALVGKVGGGTSLANLLPGSVSRQFDWAMGNGVSLVNEQAKSNEEMRLLRKAVIDLKERLPDSLDIVPVFGQ